MKYPILAIAFLSVSLHAQDKKSYTDFEKDTLQLEEVELRQARTRIKNEITPLNTEMLGRDELFRAACCNLGESFTTNPSVDVNYSDAATGAKQIKLLGLSGTYVQMLNENVPQFRGAALPFCLNYVPGTWMQSIQVSKGASSVKNGYEGITGQINIEYLKPQGAEGLHGNLYYDSNLKLDANVDGEIHLGNHLSTGLLLHYEDSQRDHDGNHDGFMDMPKVRQYNVMDRWAWVSDRWISQLAVRGLKEERHSGTSSHHESPMGQYRINMETKRVDASWKNALILNREKNANVALILNASYHEGDNQFGLNIYDVTQKNFYAQLLYEMDFNDSHSISVGASFNHDYLDEYLYSAGSNNVDAAPIPGLRDYYSLLEENTGGVYAQYTYKVGETFTAMAGIRCDASSLYDGFVTPRLHLRWHPVDWFTWRVSGGKGYRTPHALAENYTLLAASREVLLPTHSQLKQEEAWNVGTSLTFGVPIGEKTLDINADYYYTNFLQQMIIDRDQSLCLMFYDLPEGGRSYSHVAQIDATYPLFDGFSLTAAYRYQDVQVTQMKPVKTLADVDKTVRRTPPLTSRYKALVTASWMSPLEFWKVDVTYQHNGGGRMPDPYTDLWKSRYHSFGQLTAQVTREFRYCSVYLGGENLTGFKQKNPIVNRYGSYYNFFDATMVWGPTEGAMLYAGVRFNLEK